MHLILTIYILNNGVSCKVLSLHYIHLSGFVIAATNILCVFVAISLLHFIFRPPTPEIISLYQKPIQKKILVFYTCTI